jgi:hypothetical protein
VRRRRLSTSAPNAVVTATSGPGMADHRHVRVDPRTRHIETERLVLRPWQLDDDIAACAIYGAPEVSRWLCPVLPAIADAAGMRATLVRWIADTAAEGLPLGRWAVIEKSSQQLVGGVALLPLPPGCTDLEIGWQVAPSAWAADTVRKPATPWRTRPSSTQESLRFSPSCGPAITRASLRRAGSVWSGSARLTSTTACFSRFIA